MKDRGYRLPRGGFKQPFEKPVGTLELGMRNIHSHLTIDPIIHIIPRAFSMI